MRDWATSGRVKIDRAYEHVAYLEGKIQAFKNRRPYRAVPDPHAEGDRLVFVVQELEAIPLRWSAVASDAIHNLRVALDHMWQRAVWGAKSAPQQSFPAYANPECAKARFRGKEHGRLKAAVDILWSVNAFQVGNPFWEINEFDNADKHDTMTLVATSLDFVVVEVADKTQILSISDGGPPHRLKHGDVFTTTHPADMDVNVDFAFEITFGEGEILKGEPVTPTLEHFTTAVDSLADVFIEAGLLA